jgi:hypothetical protein
MGDRERAKINNRQRMKKLTLLIAMLMASSAWAEWSFYIESDVNDVTYVNYDTLQRDGNRLFVWTMINYNKRTASGVLSATTYREMDCGIPRKYRFLNFQTYNRAMGEGQENDYPTKFVPEWYYNQPDSIGYIIMNELCDASEPESNS